MGHGSGFANDSPSTKDENNAGSHGASGSSVGIKIVIVCLGLVAVFAFAVLLFKIWQKKKREEQHARLLKLFEDDDELEVELASRYIFSIYNLSYPHQAFGIDDEDSLVMMIYKQFYFQLAFEKEMDIISLLVGMISDFDDVGAPSLW
ncbi:hypothetical protein CFP56_036605 [Quercus suber]|uniref:Uncharacterized protein n=1 Tax=Quercus suber TaxID=58331 RepID=A0AAW0J679_QUESU